MKRCDNAACTMKGFQVETDREDCLSCNKSLSGVPGIGDLADIMAQFDNLFSKKG